MSQSKNTRCTKRRKKYNEISIDYRHKQDTLDENIYNYLEFLKLREAMTLRGI